MCFWNDDFESKRWFHVRRRDFKSPFLENKVNPDKLASRCQLEANVSYQQTLAFNAIKTI